MAGTEAEATPEQMEEIKQLEEQRTRELNMAMAANAKNEVEMLIHTGMEQGKSASEVVAMMDAAGMFVAPEAPAAAPAAPAASPSMPPQIPAAPRAAPAAPAPEPQLASREDQYMAAARRNMA
jgi:hypothetical protein